MSDTKTVTPPAAGDQEIVTAPTVNTRDQVVRGRGNRITGIVTGTFLALYVTWTLVPFYIMFTTSIKAEGDAFTLPAEGERVVTSAETNAFPANLPVGVVRYTANNIAEVDTDAKLDRLEIVRIFDYGLRGITGPESPVRPLPGERRR